MLFSSSYSFLVDFYIHSSSRSYPKRPDFLPVLLFKHLSLFSLNKRLFSLYSQILSSFAHLTFNGSLVSFEWISRIIWRGKWWYDTLLLMYSDLLLYMHVKRKLKIWFSISETIKDGGALEIVNSHKIKLKCTCSCTISAVWSSHSLLHAVRKSSSHDSEFN